MNEATQREGGCLCGAIRFRAAGDPVRTSICYCTQCRRQTGSAMPSFAVFPVECVEVMRGTPASYAASEQAEREFCRSCGSHLFWRGRNDVHLDVHLGAFDAPESLPAPLRQIWTRHRLPWVTQVAAVPAFPESPRE
jgi:hypothetical protein